jgi:hypothetical protein
MRPIACASGEQFFNRWGPDTGWHPHLHVLMFLEGRGFDSEVFSRVIEDAWLRSLASVGLSGACGVAVDVRIAGGEVAAYVAKFGREPAGTTWTVADEVARANVKRGRYVDERTRFTPFQLLDAFGATGDLEYRKRFAEFYGVSKGRRQLVWSKGAREALGLLVEKSDQELAEEAAWDSDVVFSLSLEAYRSLVRRGLAAALLDRVERHRGDVGVDYLAEFSSA